jgi:1-acyl-sn-glycerol-3-phosphate acyltransferase
MTAAATRRLLWRTVFRCTGGIEVRGALPSGGCVVVANHASHADAPALLAALDATHRPMVAAAADYWFCRPVKGRICRALVGGFPVRRAGGGYADLAARQAELRRGRAVVVFPAGSRRSADGRFRSGAFRLAQDAGVPVVAVRLTGTATMLPPSGRLRRAPVTVEILPPVAATDPHELAERFETLLLHPSAVGSPGRTD